MRFRHFLLCFVLLGLFVIAGCAGGESKTNAQAPPPTVPVGVGEVTRKDVPLVLKSIGNVEPFETVSIKSLVAGELVDVHFKEGQDVKKGQLLFTLDQRQFIADLKKAEGVLEKDMAQAKNARAQAARYEQLLKEGVVAKEQYDQIVANAGAAEATLDSDRAAVESAKVQVQYTKIYSPISGRTGNLMVHQGNIVKANDVPLVTINQISPIHVSFAIPEQQLAEVKKYMTAGTLKVEAVIPNDQAPAGPPQGKLDFVDNNVDPATGTIKLKGAYANNDHRLWPGQFVDIVLTLTTQQNAIVVPSKAVQTGQQGQYVFVVKPDMTVDMRAIKVTRTAGPDTVVESGLQPGDRVVTDGQLKLNKGVRVEVKQAAQPPASPQQNVPSGD
jgi:multidrug efflux system membrane fusion protein